MRGVSFNEIASAPLGSLSHLRLKFAPNSINRGSQELESRFSTDIKLGGGDIVDRFDLSDSKLNIADSIDQSIKQGAKAIFLVPAPDSVKQALKVVTTNHRRLPLIGDMANLYTLDTLKVGGEDAVGMVLAPSWHVDADPKSNFSRESRALWKSDVNSATATSYDAAQAIIEALRRETSPSRAGIQRALTASDFSANGVSGEFRFQSGDANTAIQLVEIRSANSSRSGTGYDFVPIR